MSCSQPHRSLVRTESCVFNQRLHLEALTPHSGSRQVACDKSVVDNKTFERVNNYYAEGKGDSPGGVTFMALGARPSLLHLHFNHFPPPALGRLSLQGGPRKFGQGTFARQELKVPVILVQLKSCLGW